MKAKLYLYGQFGRSMAKLIVSSDEYFMKRALREASKAGEEGEVPVGAVVVINNKVIGRGYNLTERLTDVTAHAEMQAITAASSYLGSKYLTECSIYITLEPCTMCGGALFWAQISKVVFGTRDSRRGFLSLGGKLHPKTKLLEGVLESETSEIVKEFFKKKR